MAGDEVTIAKGGEPVIRLRPYKQELQPRKGGQLHGMLHISDDFDAPLPKELLAEFHE